MPRPQTLTLDGVAHAMLGHTDQYAVCGAWNDLTVEPDAEPVMVSCLWCILRMHEVSKHGWRLREHA